MQYLDLTLPTPAENLALDEALLDEAEAAGGPRETLRFWESGRPFVVIGRSSKLEVEVDGPACRELQVPVLRRVSGGAAVVAGPGCLMYSLVLSYRLRPALRAIDEAHRLVLNIIAAALAPLAPGVTCRGTSDLCLGECKVSGNSVRAKREHLLYHGTLLYDFPLELIGRCLRMPPRQPAYRRARPHETFVANLPADAASIRNAFQAAWQADELRTAWPAEETARLVSWKYARPEWNANGTWTIDEAT
jgi:lipoate---protein ligase